MNLKALSTVELEALEGELKVQLADVRRALRKLTDSDPDVAWQQMVREDLEADLDLIGDILLARYGITVDA